MNQLSEAGFAVLFWGLAAAPAITALTWRRRRLALAGPWFTLVVVLVGAFTAAHSFWRGEQPMLDLSAVAPLAFALTVDRLSAFFLLLTCVVAAPVVLYATSYVAHHYQDSRRLWMWVLLPWFLASMVVVVTASTGFAFLFGWELMTLLSTGLILLDGDSEERRRSILIYLLMMHVGAAAVVATFLIFFGAAPGLDFASIRQAAASMPAGLRSALFLLAFVGFGTKAGIIPMHLWLPKAHPIAPSPVSALMSGVMLKTAVYGFVRFAVDMLGAGPSWWGYLVLIAGAVSGLLGILYALAERDLKRLLAYSSVENLGIIYLALGTALVFRGHNAPLWAAVALTAALLHSLNHALFKGLLFLGAGSIAHAAHSLNLDGLGGLWRRMPVTGAAFLVGCCCIVGLPLGNGFVSEWLIFRSLLAGAELTGSSARLVLPLTIGVLAMIGGLAVACFAEVFGVAFLGRPRSGEAQRAEDVPAAMRLATVVMAAACVLLGVAPLLAVRPLSAFAQAMVSAPALPESVFSTLALVPWVALVCVAAVAILVALSGAVRLTRTWACGLPDLGPRMQYTSTSFSKPIRMVFSAVYKPQRRIEVLPPDQPYFPRSISYHSIRTTSFEQTLYRPGVNALINAARRLRHLQTGNIQVYLLYVFGTLVLLLLLLRFRA